MSGDCTKLCCDGFGQNEKTAERVPNWKIRPIDRCNNKQNYFGEVGTDFKVFMPVVATATPGTVAPAAAPYADAIGIALCAKTATADMPMVIVARTGVICWSDVAASLGLDPSDQAAWWEYHVAMLPLNIYVEFK